MASVGFRWLDILEKEFDKAFVDLDLSIGELDSEEPDVVYNVRQKLCTLSSCFAQLTHKAQTIFQNSAKIEAELIHMRAELVESKAKKELLEQELHNLLLQLHSFQLGQLPSATGSRIQNSKFEPDVNTIKKKFEEEIKSSPSHNHTNGNAKTTEEFKFSPALVESSQIRAENSQLQLENSALRNSIVALNSEVYGAKLAAQYLDKELAGRIQQLQLLGREMQGNVRDKLWRQLESEILLQRHKTVVRACRRNSILSNHSEITRSKPNMSSVIGEENPQHFGDVRTVVVRRKTGQGLGISITGGREHGVPILISELEPNGPAALSNQLYIGDAILFVNDRDLRQACHREAVDILQQQTGDCRLQVQYIAADESDNSLEEDGLNFRFFDSEVCDPNDSISLHPLHSSGVMNTPTAPRTPESTSNSRTESRNFDGFENILYKPPESILCAEIVPQVHNFSNNLQIINNNNNTELITFSKTNFTETTDTILPISNDNTTLNKKIKEINSNHIGEATTVENIDNYSNKLGNSKCLNYNLNKNHLKNCRNRIGNLKTTEQYIEDNLNCSTNSLLSDNLSSPMQTSTDVFLDSEIFSTDVASNDSHSPKNIQNVTSEKINSQSKLTGSKREDDFLLSYTNSDTYKLNEHFSNSKSDQSLLNSADSCDSSPIHKINREYKKSSKKHKVKKHFGVKTLQNIFNRRGGYSDISSSASEYEENTDDVKDNSRQESLNFSIEQKVDSKTCSDNNEITSSISEISPQFEKNIHQFLSETFVKNFQSMEQNSHSHLAISKNSSSKKFFKLNGQNLRIGKALRLCPNDELDNTATQKVDQKKEKLLARYVYNSNLLSVDGIGDPDFGTPV